MTKSYASLKSNVGLNSHELLDYIKAKNLRDFHGDNLVLGFNKIEDP